MTAPDPEADRPEPHFVHPIEEEFARILDYYGIRWDYEPHTFELEWDAAGKVTQAFAPDFYLPDQEIYVELTTMRPKLITIKNRKIRRVSELYPEINVQLWKRSHLRDLMIKYGMDDEAAKLLGTEALEEDDA